MASWRSRTPRTNPQACRAAAVHCSLALAAWLGGAPKASACPDCDVGRVARAQFWHDQLAWNLTVALIPFVLMFGLAFWAERMGHGESEPSKHGE